MEVKVLFDSKMSIRKMWVAARTCYSHKNPIQLFEESKNKSVEEMVSLIKQCLDSGHLSISEHCDITVLVSGISRSATHQQVRHRHVSYSQQSQRYCNYEDKNIEYTIPDSIKNNASMEEGYRTLMMSIEELYNIFVKNGIPAEDARYVLSNATLSNMVMTLNLRELIHICHERLCTCAQKEIRQFITKVREQVIKSLPFLDTYLVPKCSVSGYCNENKNRTCGRYPLKNK